MLFGFFLPANELKLPRNIDNGRKLFLKFGSVDSGGSLNLGHPKVFSDEPGASVITICTSTLQFYCLYNCH